MPIMSGIDIGQYSEMPTGARQTYYSRILEFAPRRVVGTEMHVRTGMPAINDNVFEPGNFGQTVGICYLWRSLTAEDMIGMLADIDRLIPPIEDLPDKFSEYTLRYGMLPRVSDDALDPVKTIYMGRSEEFQYLLFEELMWERMLDKIVSLITHKRIGRGGFDICRVGYADYAYDMPSDTWTCQTVPVNSVRIDNGYLSLEHDNISIRPSQAAYYANWHLLTSMALCELMAASGMKWDIDPDKKGKLDKDDFRVGSVDALAWQALKLGNGGWNKSLDMSMSQLGTIYYSPARQEFINWNRYGYNELCFKVSPQWARAKLKYDILNVIAEQRIGGLQVPFYLKRTSGSAYYMKGELNKKFRCPYADGSSAPWLQAPNNQQPKGILLPYTVGEVTEAKDGTPLVSNRYKEVHRIEMPSLHSISVDRGEVSETIDPHNLTHAILNVSFDGRFLYRKQHILGWWISKTKYYKSLTPNAKRMVAYLISQFADTGQHDNFSLPMDASIFEPALMIPVSRMDVTQVKIPKLDGVFSIIPTQELMTSEETITRVKQPTDVAPDGPAPEDAEGQEPITPGDGIGSTELPGTE
jgi:hypothetical protein